jgi:hypothetical protein
MPEYKLHTTSRPEDFLITLCPFGEVKIVRNKN